MQASQAECCRSIQSVRREIFGFDGRIETPAAATYECEYEAAVDGDARDVNGAWQHLPTLGDYSRFPWYQGHSFIIRQPYSIYN